MAQINAVNCGVGSGNLGVPTCTIDLDMLVGAIPIPKGRVFTAAELVDFRTTLQALLVNNSYALRAQVMGRFLEIDDQSEDIQEKTWGYGTKTVTRGEVYNWVFPYLDGGFCRHRQMLKFKDRQGDYDWLFVDKSKNILGTRKVDANGVLAFGGVDLTQFYTYNWKPATGSDPAMYRVKFALADAAQINEDAAFITVDFDVFSLAMVQDVDLFPVGATAIVGATGDINVGVYSGCGGNNLVNNLPAIVATGNFLVTNYQTGAAITVTAVTAGGTGTAKYIAFNLDDTDTDYPAPGEYLQISLASVSTVFASTGQYLEATPPLVLEVS